MIKAGIGFKFEFYPMPSVAFRGQFTHEKSDLLAYLRGVADEPQGAELERLKEVYFQVYPDGRDK